MEVDQPVGQARNRTRNRRSKRKGLDENSQRYQSPNPTGAEAPVSDLKMMQTFSYGRRAVRAVENGGRAWFVGKDVCAALGIANSRDAIARLDEDEIGVGVTDTNRGKRKVAIVSESGALHLIFRSNKPEAKVFRRWVTETVLPAVLRTGSYNTSDTTIDDRPEIVLPAPGRYITELLEDGRVICQLASREEAAAQLFLAEGRALAYMLKMIEAHWTIVLKSRVFEDSPTPIHGAAPLHNSITEGNRLATQFMPHWDVNVGRQPS